MQILFFHILQSHYMLITYISSKHYDKIRYDTEYLTRSKKLRDSQLCLPHGTNEKYKKKN